MSKNRHTYETRGGTVSEADTFAQLLEHLRLAEEAAYVIGHLNKTCGQDLKGQGFLAIGEMLKLTQINVTNLATKSLRSQSGYR
jgi:hypothetical protein